MRTLYVEYSEWKSVTQAYGLTVYEQMLSVDSAHIWSGTRDLIFRSNVAAGDFADYDATFPSGRVAVASEDSAILGVVQENSPTLTTPRDLDRRLKAVNVQRVNLSGTTNILMIDLDNEGGKYPHPATASGLFVGGILMSLRKNLGTDVWLFQMGVVLSINATQSSIAYFAPGTADLIDSGTLAIRQQVAAMPAVVDMTVSEGALVNSATNAVFTDTSIDTNAPLPDIGGVNRVVAPGDLILKATRVAGAGAASLEYILWYWGE